MRISDRMLNRNFIYNINSQKAEVENLREKVATQTKVEKPSDDPRAAADILKYTSSLNSVENFKKNIDKTLTFLNRTTTVMQSILDLVGDVDVQLTELQNSANDGNNDIFADKFSLDLDSLVEYANQKFDGKYLFGGTDFGEKPFDYTTSKANVIQKASDISGKINVKVSPNAPQTMNVNGAELFGTILNFDGNLNKNSAVGDSITNSNKVYDVEGNEYDVATTIKKTGADQYELTYEVKDATGNVVAENSSSPVQLVFDTNKKMLKTMDGRVPKLIHVSNSNKYLNFYIDVRSITEKEESSQLSSTINQKLDIFNVIAKIRDTVKAGKKPSEELIKAVKDFHQKLINKMSEVGAEINRLNDSKSMLENQQLEYKNLLANTQQVDVVDAVTKMQYYDYLLQVSYKMSSMILPKSILDYL